MGRFLIIISSNELNFYYCCFVVVWEQFFINFLISTNKPDAIFINSCLRFCVLLLNYFFYISEHMCN